MTIRHSTRSWAYHIGYGSQEVCDQHQCVLWRCTWQTSCQQNPATVSLIDLHAPSPVLSLPRNAVEVVALLLAKSTSTPSPASLRSPQNHPSRRSTSRCGPTSTNSGEGHPKPLLTTVRPSARNCPELFPELTQTCQITGVVVDIGSEQPHRSGRLILKHFASSARQTLGCKQHRVWCSCDLHVLNQTGNLPRSPCLQRSACENPRKPCQLWAFRVHPAPLRTERASERLQVFQVYQ